MKLKYIFTLLIVLFSINVVFADIGTWSESASFQDDYTEAGLTGYNTVAYTADRIFFNDISTSHAIRWTSFAVAKSQWSGGTDSSYWAEVIYSISGTPVATGQYGWNQGENYVYVTAFFNDDVDNILDQYSGAQVVTISGSHNVHIMEGGVHSRTPATGDYVGQGSSNMAYIGWYNGATNQVAHRASGDVTHTVYLGYDWSNNYNYYSTGVAYVLNVTRSDQDKSNITIHDGYETIYQDDGLSDYNIDIYGLNLTNDVWSVTVRNSYGDVIYDTFEFDLVPEENSIYWGLPNYVVDDVGSYVWYMEDDEWDSILYSKKISIYRDGTLVERFDLPAQSGSGYFEFDKQGIYEIKLQHTSILFPFRTYATDTTAVNVAATSKIFGPTSVVMGESFNISYVFGITPTNAYGTGVQLAHIDEGISLLESFYSIQSYLPLNTSSQYNLTGLNTKNEGTYILLLVDANRGTLATSRIFESEYNEIPTELNITTSYINISQSTYHVSDIVYGFYGIDNNNLSNRVLLEIYNYDRDVVTQSYPLIDQLSDFSGMIKIPRLDGFLGNLDDGFMWAYPGSNKIRLAYNDGVTTTEIVYANFTVTTTNAYGYGLQVSDYEVCPNTRVTITATIPTTATLKIFAPNGAELQNYTLNASTTINFVPVLIGGHRIELYDVVGQLQTSTAVIVLGDACGITPEITGGTGEGTEVYNNFLNFMSLPIFWGLIIYIGVVGGLVQKTRDGEASMKGIGVLAFILLQLFAIAGLWAPYTMYIVISSWIILAVFFVGTGRMVTGGAD